MEHIQNCQSIEEVRTQIDRIDRQIVGLLAARGAYVKQAAYFKKTADDVKAPQRVEQVIAKVTSLAAELGANPSVTEQTYRAMISGFINAERPNTRCWARNRDANAVSLAPRDKARMISFLWRR